MPSFSEMPPPIKAAAFIAGGGTVVGGVGMLATTGGVKSTLLLIGLALIICAVVLVIYAFILLSRRRKRAKEFGEDFGKPRQGTAKDAQEIAKMEHLRKQFVDGMAKYRKEGYDIYEMPWFLIMGEPGSGKSYALRKSNIGFLPGLQNELQGGGGTYTMDWWFTREAVLLDTAGRFAMEEATTEGDASELSELLRLLRKHRRNCPINGMILVISAESLLSDSAEEIELTAKRLARTIHRVQRDLDVRFPIIVWVTKTDMVPGFRTYFESISNPDRQHQMLGWSNPEDLDAPFHPDQVAQHMVGVINELRERRWTLLDQQKPRGNARPLDAVDSLFAFPEEFNKIMSPLQRYLELIFVGSRKPPFLRGIYFNSAVTEGKEVDKQIAEAMGMSVAEYNKQGGGFSRDKAYFLRDSLAKKLFVEKNLVTRASKAMSSLRVRQWLLVGGVALGVIAMVGWAWFAHNQLKHDILAESVHWQYFAQRIATGGDSLNGIKLVAPGTDGVYPYRGEHPLGEEAGLKPDATNYLDYYWRLSKFSSQQIPISPVFRIFASKVETGTDRRKQAWRIAFKTGILQPVVAYTGEKLTTLPNWQGAPEEDALFSMLRWEGAVQQGPQFKPEMLAPNPTSDFFLGHMINFLSATNIAENEQLRLNDMLFDSLEQDPARSDLTNLQSVTFNEVLTVDSPGGPVGNALANSLKKAQTSRKEIMESADSFSNVVTSLTALKKSEGSLLGSFQDSADPANQSSTDAAATYYSNLGTQYEDYLAGYQRVTQEHQRIDSLGTNGELEPKLKVMLDHGQSEINQPFQRLQSELTRLHQSLRGVAMYQNAIDEIQGTITSSMKDLSGHIDQLINQIRPFDKDYYSPGPGGTPKLDERFQKYWQALMLYKTTKPDWTARGNPLSDALHKETAFEQDVEKWPAPPSATITLDAKFKASLETLAASALSYQTNYYARQFAAYCAGYMKDNLAFPYFYETGGPNTPLSFDKLVETRDSLQQLSNRVASIFGEDVPSIDAIRKRMKTRLAAADSLIVQQANGDPAAPMLRIEVSQSEKYLKPGQKLARDLYAVLRLDHDDATARVVFAEGKPWQIPLNGQELIFDCSAQGTPDWKPLVNQTGEWSPLKFLIENMEPIEGEPDTYVVRLKAPDGTFFVLKFSIVGKRLPYRTKEEWQNSE
jgi:hypothetical protein